MSDGLSENRERVGDLTAEERAELDALRAERESRAKDNSIIGDTQPEKELPNTHWIHYADGSVETAKGVTSHPDGVPVIGVYEIPENLREGAEENQETVHRF